MEKSSMLKIILLFNIITFGFSLHGSSASAEDPLKDVGIRKYTPEENTLEKILFLKDKFERNRTYTTVEGNNNFKIILIGIWGAHPKGTVEFKSDGRFEGKNFIDSKFTKGFWDFQDGILKMSSDKIKWGTYRVESYELWFKDLSNRKRGGAYSFSISFDKMICDMSSVLQISFYTK